MVQSLDVPAIDPAETTNQVCRFIRDVVDRARAKGVVVGLSGGVDSSVTATLCVKALGPSRVLALLMPTSFTPKMDMEDAVNLAKSLGIEYKVISIDEIVEAFLKVLPYKHGDLSYRMPVSNLRARIRMVVLYYHANLMKRLVAGSGDRSELLIGYFTKYGDGAVDFLPIAHLYKTQVRELAKWLGIPERIAYKPSSPQLYPGHRAVDELPADYPILDKILVGLFELKLKPREVAERLNIAEELVLETLRRFKSTNHKRRLPPMLKPLPTL